MVPQTLPQDCNQPEESLKKGGNERQKVHRVHPASRTISQCPPPSSLSGVISRVVIQCPGVTDKTLMTTAHQPRDRTRLPTVASNHSGVHFPGSDARIEQEDRTQTSNSSPAGSHAIRKTDVELGKRPHSVSTGPVAPTLAMLSRKSDLPPKRKKRLTVDGWAKQKQTAWSACQIHSRVHLLGRWWLASKRPCLFSCSKGRLRCAEIPLERFDVVQSPIKDKLLCELELDRLPAPSGSRCQRSLDRVFPSVPHLPITYGVDIGLSRIVC